MYENVSVVWCFERKRDEKYMWRFFEIKMCVVRYGQKKVRVMGEILWKQRVFVKCKSDMCGLCGNNMKLERKGYMCMCGCCKK